ncbi:MAG TPA: M23 family metallopeptidase [Thermoanaerobaculia bacterium]|nr:M23 family metallopeptidase [Thermoanaerobaculia bacterium]
MSRPYLRIRRRTLPGLALAILVCGAAAAARTSETRLSARPGTVVRWSASATEECRADGRSFLPHGEICYFPIDLERTGEMTIERVRAGTTERAVVAIGDYPYTVQHVTLPTDRHVELSPQDLARSERERERVEALWTRAGPRRFDLPIARPLARLSSQGSFGKRRVFNGQPRSPHSGEDYRASAGTPVSAAAPGVVALAEEHFFGGRSVFVDHGDGLVSMYLHLSEILVEVDQEVKAGDLVGRVGATGRASGPHLHFGLRWRGARVDPAVLLAAE